MSYSKSAFSTWPATAFANMAFQSTMLAFEASQVIGLRLTKMALSDAAFQKKEAELMVSEKMAAAADVGHLVVKAALEGRHDMGAGKVVQHYRSKVRANRRRLGG